MIRFADVSPCEDVHQYLVAFCALAIEIFPEDDWITVQPKLQKSWERYAAERHCGWQQVSAAAQARWEASRRTSP